MEFSYQALRSLTSSRLRKDILKSLESPMRLCDLKRAVKSNAPNTSSKARDLQDLGLIKREHGDYRITPAGRVVRERLARLSDTVDAFYGNREFWERMLGHLPDDIVCRMHEFKGAKLIRSSRDDLDRVKHEIVRRLREARDEVEVVLPMHCECILEEVRALPRTVDTRLKTLKEDPSVRYGMVKTNGTIMLFTEMLDMALILEKKP